MKPPSVRKGTCRRDLRKKRSVVLTTKTNNEYKPVAGLRCCRLTGLNATSLKVSGGGLEVA